MTILFNFVNYKLNIITMIQNYINSIEDLIAAYDHPYRMGEFLTDETSIFEVDEDDNINQALIDSCEPDTLLYIVNWEDNSLYTEDGIKIESVY